MKLEKQNEKYYKDGVEIDEATYNTLNAQMVNSINITNAEDGIIEDVAMMEDINIILHNVLYEL